MKTYVAKPTDRERNWLVVDATGQTLGRLATQIADALRGKRKPEYTPHVDTGRLRDRGQRREDLGDGQQARGQALLPALRLPRRPALAHAARRCSQRRPEEVIRLAVKGMLPRNRLARKQLTKLKVYAGPDHPHVAQKPQPMEIST